MLYIADREASGPDWAVKQRRQAGGKAASRLPSEMYLSCKLLPRGEDPDRVVKAEVLKPEFATGRLPDLTEMRVLQGPALGAHEHVDVRVRRCHPPRRR